MDCVTPVLLVVRVAGTRCRGMPTETVLLFVVTASLSSLMRPVTMETPIMVMVVRVLVNSKPILHARDSPVSVILLPASMQYSLIRLHTPLLAITSR